MTDAMEIVVALVTDRAYETRAKQTIEDIRGAGQWRGDLLWITVDFEIPSNDPWIRQYEIKTWRVPSISCESLFTTWKSKPIPPMADGRHYGKTGQWNKFYTFHVFLRQWVRVLYVDAGMRMYQSLQHILDACPMDNAYLYAPDDALPGDNGRRLACQFAWSSNPDVAMRMRERFGSTIVHERYFLNCIYYFDTRIIEKHTFSTLCQWMRDYPISMCNEMGIMNLLFSVDKRQWRPLPEKVILPDATCYLFGWSLHNYPSSTHKQDFVCLKYP